MQKDKTHDAGVEVSPAPIAPAEASDQGWEDESHECGKSNIVLVLPHDDVVLEKIRNISDTRLLEWLEHHPAEMGVEETVVDGIRVLVGIGISVVGAMTTAPPSCRAFKCSSTSEGEEVLERSRSDKGAMREASMISSSDAETSE